MVFMDLEGGGVGGGGGGAEAFLQRFDPLPTQRVPSLVLFKKSIFGRPNRPKSFSKGAFWGERAPKKRYFISNFSKKCPKTSFLTCFFKILPAESLAKTKTASF